MNWDEFYYFGKNEFDCHETGKNKMRSEFVRILDQVRAAYGKPIIVTSGYRDSSHSIERVKKKPGEHTYGVAADLAISGKDVAPFISIAYEFGIRRFGIKQHGPQGGRFIHIGMGDRDLGFPQSTWSY